ncbi:hypothetical protein NN561_020366 [Cricetulus griseus]
MQRPFALPLQPLASPSSPQHWKAMSSHPCTEELAPEDTFAGPVLREKPLAYTLASSPRHPAVDQSPPAAGPAPRSHVSYSTLACLFPAAPGLQWVLIPKHGCMPAPRPRPPESRRDLGR